VRARRARRGSSGAARGARCAVRAPRRTRERTHPRETKLPNARAHVADEPNYLGAEHRDVPRRSTYHPVAATEMPDGSAKMARGAEKVRRREGKVRVREDTVVNGSGEFSGAVGDVARRSREGRTPGRQLSVGLDERPVLEGQPAVRRNVLGARAR